MTQFKINLKVIGVDPHITMNEVLRHTFGSPANTYESGLLDLKNIHNTYIPSPNLGLFSTLGPRGECNNIKTTAGSRDYGCSILDNVVISHDYIDVSKQLLSVMEFKLSSACGGNIPSVYTILKCHFQLCVFSIIKPNN